ncbi:MAG: class I SAM-dependent methyltransferase [Deltaproteobacteria bacterium]|nr:class I SAM-dependent methyltransferase [Deltaproteobacteria bacterium]
MQPTNSGSLYLGGVPTAAEIMKRHNLDPNDPAWHVFLQNPSLLGLDPATLTDLNPQQAAELIIGEYFALVAKQVSRLASDLLFQSQWGHKSPEWFDHRHHFLNPDRFCNDYWTLSVDNVTRVLPLGAKLLNLCSGDGFYDYYFFRRRAAEITAVDFNQPAHSQAVRLHKAENITYLYENVLTYQPHSQYYDTVVIRGAIEHFSEEHQLHIYKMAQKALKPGGWFVGDTVANVEQEGKLLGWHETEWRNEDEMRASLSKVFSHVETNSVTSEDRITLLWRCRV